MIDQYISPYYATCWLYKAMRARKEQCTYASQWGSHFLLTKHACAPIIIYHQGQKTNMQMAIPGKIWCLDNPSCRISEVRINEGPL